MHEFAVAKALVDAAIDVARDAKMCRVTRLRCRIGDMRQVDSWLLEEAFVLAREGTVCEVAELSVERRHMRLECEQCGIVFDVRDWDWRCPDCGSTGCNAHGGDELELTGIDGDPADDED
ncbi:MAG TPA: hydrogenase maturation nickel metallochaperone HypA [Phycisphaerae bacterium]|nr:hydrogenase maturation nickel metallochaperone HypA [Phycisphaerae bacterium]HRW52336.1 hydrogenase maturation nickel metallochaperone HypA [Phycisphaerae bacterium]